MKYYFCLKGWLYIYCADATTERKAKKDCNPYVSLYIDAMQRAHKYKRLGVKQEETWYRKMAAIHEQAAREFHAAAFAIQYRLANQSGQPIKTVRQP